MIYTDAIDTLFKHRFQENLYYKAEVVDDSDVNKAFKSQDLAKKRQHLQVAFTLKGLQHGFRF